MDSNYGRGGVTSNEDVLRNFCTNTNEVKANNLSTHYDSNSDEILLRQYGVLIAKRKGDKLMITSKRYSVTTSKVQNELLRIAMEYGLDVQKTNEFAKGGGVKSNRTKGKYIVNPFFYGTDDYWERRENLERFLNYTNEEIYSKWLSDEINDENAVFMVEEQNGEVFNPKMKYAKGGEVEHQKLSASLKSKLKSANNILKRYGGREITEHEATMWNVYHNATSGFEAGYEAFDVAGAKNYHNATTREYHAIGDNLIDISRAITGVSYDDYNFRGTKEENENYYLMNYKNKKYAEGGEITLTKSEINEYAKLTWAKEKLIDRMLRLNGDCIDNRQALEEQLDDIYTKTQELQNRLREKYGDAIIKPFSFPSKSKTALNSQFAKGGNIAQGNYEMMLSQAKEVEHHVEELQNILKGEKDIDAWVVAKMENVSSTLSDITHYLDGKTEYAHGGKMSRGGYFGKDALVKDLSEEFASEELLAKFRKKSGIKDTQLTKPNVIAFAYTDYGGDFIDKVAIEYFLENHPKNIVVENTGYSGQNAIVWGKVAMDWVEATEDYAFGYEDFESFYYDKVYKAEEQVFSEYLYQLQRDGYELDYDEVLQWLLENKGGYFSITTEGLDFYDGDLTKELLAEGLIEKSEEYAKGGEMHGEKGYDYEDDFYEVYDDETGKLLMIQAIDQNDANSISERIDFEAFEDGDELEYGWEERFAKGGELKDDGANDIKKEIGVLEEKRAKWIGQSEAKSVLTSPYDSKIDNLQKELELIRENAIEKYNVKSIKGMDENAQKKMAFQFYLLLQKTKSLSKFISSLTTPLRKKTWEKLQYKSYRNKWGYKVISNKIADTIRMEMIYAKGGNINSKTNNKMATKKVKDGQSAPQTDRWIFAYNKGGYNYYTQKEVPYKKVVDANKKGAPVGYRFSKFAEEKGITNNRFRKPTKSEVEQYAGKKKSGKLIMYRETRSNKSDVNPKKRI